MKSLLLLLAALSVAIPTYSATPSATQRGDANARQRVIRQSIASYPGSCACPYSVARNGSRCGARSAWNRRGGYAPKCYPSDVTQADLAGLRR